MPSPETEISPWSTNTNLAAIIKSNPIGDDAQQVAARRISIVEAAISPFYCGRAGWSALAAGLHIGEVHCEVGAAGWGDQVSGERLLPVSKNQARGNVSGTARRRQNF